MPHTDILEWVESLPEDFVDVSTFRYMRKAAQGIINTNDKMRADIVTSAGEQFAIDVWDIHFEAETLRCREAIVKIDAGMAKLGYINNE